MLRSATAGRTIRPWRATKTPMTVWPVASLSLLVAGLVACRPAPHPQQPDVVRLTTLFGPVVSPQVISGRVDKDDEVILVAGSAIVRVDLAGRRAMRVPIAVAAGDACWGLARLADGSLWTLKGHKAVIRVEPDGRVSRELPLAEPHVSLFGAGSRLLFQKAAFGPPGPALTAGEPGGSGGEPWSDMRTREFPGMARAQSAALNMVACGGTAGGETPCWFQDEAAVFLIGGRGETRRIVLTGLSAVSPEILLTAENPPRPVRDVFVDRQGRVWVLSSGAPPVESSPLPGAWILARFTGEGIPDGQVRLAQPVRLILRVSEAGVVMLSGDGYVSAVPPW